MNLIRADASPGPSGTTSSSGMVVSNRSLGETPGTYFRSPAGSTDPEAISGRARVVSRKKSRVS